MSFWLESLRTWNPPPQPQAPAPERYAHARHLLQHLAMPVPRDWWQRMLDGQPTDDIKARLIRELRDELACALGSEGPSLGALLALPFALGHQQLGDIDVALELAQQLLAQRPDLQNLAHRIEFPIDLGPQCRGDNKLTANLRRHQSWYRANVLGLHCGAGPRPNSTSNYGNMLSKADGENGSNFLTPAIFEVAKQRMAQNIGTVEPFRLLHNMLSSQPMCFNLFGPLVNDLELATRLMQALLPQQVAQVTEVKIEFAPEPAGGYLGDKTAFDAYVAWRNHDNGMEFMGFETKLSEPFSQQIYDSPLYRRWMTEDSPWLPDSTDKVADKRHNQLWRDHLLAVAHHRRSGQRGRLALVRHPEDLDCADTALRYRQLLRQGDDSFVEFTLEQIVDAWSGAVRTEEERRWLAAFRLRYLDLAANGLLDQAWA